MEDSEQLSALKLMVARAVEQCNDPDTLDLVYKLLLLSYPSQREQSTLTSMCVNV